MNKNITSLNPNEFYTLDKFFKIQFTDSFRYGTMGYFYWKIILNPYNTGIVNIIENNNTISATTTITPKLLRLNNNIFDSAEIGDTYTDKNYQGKGFFATLVNESSKNSIDQNTKFIYGTPNHLSLPAYIKRTNFEIFHDFFIQSYFFNLKLNIFPKSSLGKIISIILNVFYQNIVKFKINFNYILTSNANNINITEIDILEDDFDLFWEKAKSEWNFIFERNYISLKWRFFDNPEIYKFYLVKKDNMVIGYFVYRILISSKIKRLVIADYLFLKDHEIVFNYCLNFIKVLSIKENINVIQLWCANKSIFNKNLVNENFIKGNNIPLIKYKNDINFSDLKSVHFTISDTDNI